MSYIFRSYLRITLQSLRPFILCTLHFLADVEVVVVVITRDESVHSVRRQGKGMEAEHTTCTTWHIGHYDGHIRTSAVIQQVQVNQDSQVVKLGIDECS